MKVFVRRQMSETLLRTALKAMVCFGVCAVTLVHSQVGTCLAQGVFLATDGPEQEPKPNEITISPSAIREPFLDIELLPPLRDRRPGNAIVWYGRVKAEQNNFFGNRELLLKVDEWLDKPLDELRQEVNPIISAESSIYYQLKQGSYSLETDWQLPIYDGNYFYILLPDVQEARMYAKILASTARWQIAHGQFEEAIETLRIGYSLARKCGEAPTLINTLVGIAIAGVMNDQLLTLMEQPEAPNLYWAISSLPHPLVDPRLGLEAEFDGMELTIGDAVNAEGRENDLAFWADQLKRTEEVMSAFPQGPVATGVAAELRNAAARVDDYITSKELLIQEGWDAAEVEAMPVGRAIITANWLVYKKRRDRLMRWLLLPDAERIAFKDRYLEGLEELPSLSLLNKDLVIVEQAIHIAILRQGRQFAFLRTVEALRAHAAINDGKFPESLDEITIVPVPFNPFTGRPFEYELKDGVATIKEGTDDRATNPVNYIVHLR